MKKVKFVLIAIMALMCALASGCSLKEVATRETEAFYKMAHETELAVQRHHEEIRDEEFWSSLNTTAELIQQAIEPKKQMAINLRLEDEDGSIINLSGNIYESGSFGQISDERRKYRSNVILLGILEDEQVTEALSAKKKVEVTGLILTWQESKKETYSACDSNLDGHWDYVAEGGIYFTDRSDAKIVTGNNGLDVVSIKTQAKYQAIDAAPTTLTSLKSELN